MADQAITSTDAAKEKYYFLLRRLHSLSGIVPIGAFLCFHLTVNATILAGPGKFQFAVDQIHQLDKAGVLIPVEMATIFLPILFHAILGMVIVFTASPNWSDYRYGSNIRYTFQRITGVIAFAFIIFHVWQMHWLGKPLGGGLFDPHNAAKSAALIAQGSSIWGCIYAIGVISSVFHFANGVWTFLITWGVTIGRKSQRITGYICTALGIVVVLIGLSGIYGLKTLDTKSLETGGDDAHAVHASFVVDGESGGH